MARRLAAVLAADIAGYSLLIGADEEGTIRSLRGHMSAIEPAIGLNGGRIVKTMGDGFLAEFPSVVDAVACAETMQRQMAERNATDDGPRMAFRMGVHVGDIVADGDDILGDGVNIAARLESIAEPGGIVISGRVYEDVVGKLDLAFTDLGPQQLKNIARPISAFAVQINTAAPRTPQAARPEKPSIAVLAFDNLSSDPEQDYFADGITEDIITGLSRVPWIFVIARNSSFSYKGLSVDIRRIGQELGVRYVLEGSVRKAGNRLRVTGQLIDAETGNHIWADRFDGVVEDVFDLQDQITETVVSAIAPQIRAAEIERATRKRPDTLDAYDHFLRAQLAINQFRFQEADTQLEQALKHSPTYSDAMALRAWIRTIVWSQDSLVSPENTELALAWSEEVLAAPDADIEAQAYAGYVVDFFAGKLERGIRYIQRAIELCPNCISAWGSSCLLHGMNSQPEIALAHGEEALKLSPRDPIAYRVHMGMCFAHLAQRDYPALIDRGRMMRAFYNPVPVFRLYEIAARVKLGEMDRAQKLTATFMNLYPQTTVAKLRAARSAAKVVRPNLYEPVYESLAAAGVPE